MKFNKEKDFLNRICKNIIIDLINNQDINFTEKEKQVLIHRHIERKSPAKNNDLAMGETLYFNTYRNALERLQSYLHSTNDELLMKFYR